MISEPVRVMRGKTAHVRFTPYRRAFSYGITMVEIDTARLNEASNQSALFSVTKRAPVLLNTKKRGSLGKKSLRTWARELFEENDLEVGDDQITLLTFPQTFFYSFSPLSLWFLRSESGGIRGIIYEVNNTFGERHSYVANLEAVGDRQRSEKAFHVSPFFAVSGDYRFTVQNSESRFQLLIENLSDQERHHTATIDLRPQPATTRTWLRYLLLSPFAPLGVIAAIHWEAFWIWARGARYHSKPAPPTKAFTSTHDAGKT